MATLEDVDETLLPAARGQRSPLATVRLGLQRDNFPTQLAWPRSVRCWSLTTRPERPGKIGATVMTRDSFGICRRTDLAVSRKIVTAIRTESVGSGRRATRGEVRHHEMKNRLLDGDDRPSSAPN